MYTPTGGRSLVIHKPQSVTSDVQAILTVEVCGVIINEFIIFKTQYKKRAIGAVTCTCTYVHVVLGPNDDSTS